MEKVNDKQINILGLGDCLIEKEFPSYNRKVFQVVDCFGVGEMWVVKILQQIAGAKTMEEMRQGTLEYVARLQELGVPCVSIYQLLVDGDRLIEIEPVFETDLGTLVKELDGSKCIQVLKQGILQPVLRPLFLSSKDCNLSVGIDVAPRNYLSNDGGKSCYYGDFVPFKLRLEDGSVTLEYPEATDPKVREIGYLRHYNKVGILLTLQTQFLKLRPELRQEFQQVVEEFLQDIGEQGVIDALNASPVCKLQKDLTTFESNVEIIKNLSVESLGYLQLRDAACLMAFWDFQGQATKDRLNEFFKLSHMQDKPVAIEKVAEFKRRLIEWNTEILK